MEHLHPNHQVFSSLDQESGKQINLDVREGLSGTCLTPLLPFHVRPNFLASDQMDRRFLGADSQAE